jgi:hypothetical protein
MSLIVNRDEDDQLAWAKADNLITAQLRLFSRRIIRRHQDLQRAAVFKTRIFDNRASGEVFATYAFTLKALVTFGAILGSSF